MTPTDWFVITTLIGLLVLVLVVDVIVGRAARQHRHEVEADRRRLLNEIRRQP